MERNGSPENKKPRRSGARWLSHPPPNTLDYYKYNLFHGKSQVFFVMLEIKTEGGGGFGSGEAGEGEECLIGMLGEGLLGDSGVRSNVSLFSTPMKTPMKINGAILNKVA